LHQTDANKLSLFQVKILNQGAFIQPLILFAADRGIAHTRNRQPLRSGGSVCSPDLLQTMIYHPVRRMILYLFRKPAPFLRFCSLHYLPQT
jgi:hypothetical protein